MKTIVLIITGFVFNLSAVNDSLKFKRLIVYTSALEYFPTTLNTYNLNIGAEVYLNKWQSVSLNAGQIQSYGPARGYFEIYSENTRGYKVRGEWKYFLNKRKVIEPAMLVFWPHIFQYHTQQLSNTGFYLSADIIYQNTLTDRKEWVQDPDSQRSIFIDNFYEVRRQLHASHIKFGYQCIKKYGLTVDFAVGAGAKHITSSYKNRKGNEYTWPGAQRELNGKLFDQGSAFIPSMIYHFKLGFTI